MPTDLKDFQFVALASGKEHFGFFGGVGTGKTFTGSHFSIQCVEERPDLTGLIGANTHDQLSQATMRELLFWLEHYGYDFRVDERPEGAPRKFKNYKNILSIRSKAQPSTWTHVFTRIMSMPNPLRGVEFSWYWLDESRDTPENTHDVVLGRMREDPNFRRGLLTTTTNGQDWAYRRFVLGAKQGQRMYGSMHVPTILSVKKGIISKAFYETLRASYSELLAQQELDAKHVNIRGGKAYYAFGEHNRKRISPWGQIHPDPVRPLIVGCDFNYAPAPCIWMVGQLGPDVYHPDGHLWSDHLHWFGEIAASEVSTPQMTRMLLGRYPGFFYRIFGDASGNRGTTSNAGENDYAQIKQEMFAHGAQCMIDADQANPHIKDRIENMNRLAKNALGEVRMTYNPNTCPNFDADVRVVGWKPTVQLGRAKLDNCGDLNRTHATDGGGYATWKVLPLKKMAFLGSSMPSPIVTSIQNAI